MRKAGLISINYHLAQMDAYVCTVLVDLVKPDPLYQRKPDQRHANHMATEDVKVWPLPIVSFRDDTLYVPDGQHRMLMFKAKKYTTTEVMVKFGLTPASEASLYVDLNDNKRPNPWNIFKACVTAGSLRHIEIVDAIHAVGLTLSYEEAGADMRNTSPLYEAKSVGVFDEWLKSMCSFINVEGRLGKLSRAIDFQRGLLDVIRLYGTLSKKANDVLLRVGEAAITDTANHICGCARTNRNHFKDAFEHILNINNVLPGVRRKAA